MTDRYPRSYALTARALKEGWSIEPAWREVIAAAGGKKPSAAWKRIGKISIRKDVDRMTNWLEECHVTHPPQPSVKGYWGGSDRYPLQHNQGYGFGLYLAIPVRCGG